MTSVPDVTREGKGRARPGPSSSAPARSRPQPQSIPAGGWTGAALGFLVVLVATAASSVLGTQAHQHSSPAAMAVLAAAGAFVGVLMSVGLPRVAASTPAEWLLPAIAGVGGFAVAPWLVMAHRYTDAPPGTEVLFFSVVSWGGMLAVALAVTSRQWLSRAGGALLALAAAAAVLGNWERPSSFSPLVRYAREELYMLLAGALWVALVLALAWAARRGSLRVSAVAAALGGLAGAGLLAGVALSRQAIVVTDLTGPGAIGYGIAVCFSVAGTMMALRAQRPEAVAAAYVLVPIGVSLIAIVEWAVGPLGPQPMVLEPMIAGGVIGVLAAGIAWGTGRHRLTLPSAGPADGGSAAAGSVMASASAPARGSRATVALRALATVVALGSVAVAVVALTRPTMTGAVNGLRTDGTQLRAVFDLYGYEVAGPWLALALGLVALGMAIERSAIRDLWLRALAGLAAAGAWWTAAATPLRTLTSFIPSDVQVDYGSEFSRIDFSGDPTVWAIAAVAGAAGAIALTLAGGLMAGSRSDGT